AQVLHRGELLMRGYPVADGIERHHEFTGLSTGHPGPVVHTANAKTADHKVVPALSDSRGRRRAPQCTTKDGVVPVHRVAVLFGERLGMHGDRVAQSAQCQLPLRLRFPNQSGERQRTTDAVEHTGAPGHQRFWDWSRFTSGPTDLAIADL